MTSRSGVTVDGRNWTAAIAPAPVFVHTPAPTQAPTQAPASAPASAPAPAPAFLSPSSAPATAVASSALIPTSASASGLPPASVSSARSPAPAPTHPPPFLENSFREQKLPQFLILSPFLLSRTRSTENFPSTSSTIKTPLPSLAAAAERRKTKDKKRRFCATNINHTRLFLALHAKIGIFGVTF